MSDDVKPVKKQQPKKPETVVVVSPDGRDYRTSVAEAERLNRTSGYKFK